MLLREGWMKTDILDELFRKYYNEAMLYAYTLCRNEAIAEDIVSDAFYKALKKLPDEVPHFKYWLLRVVKTTFLDFVRKERKKVELPSNLPDKTDSLIDKLIINEEYAALYKAIDTLDDYYREIITLHYFESIKFKEIALILDKTEEQIKSGAYEARQKLKKMLINEMS